MGTLREEQSPSSTLCSVLSESEGAEEALSVEAQTGWIESVSSGELSSLGIRSGLGVVLLTGLRGSGGVLSLESDEEDLLVLGRLIS